MNPRQAQQRATRVLAVTNAEIAPNPTNRRRFDAVLGGVGQALIATGVLMLLFVAYQLWGTGLSEQRAQSDLKRTFSTQLPAVPTYGDPVTRISSEQIGLNKIVVAGVDYKALQKGPGLFDGSPLPGQLGNVAIAGHRTSYGAPFSQINELGVGDSIVLTRGTSTYTYEVYKEPFVVDPSQVEVVKSLDNTIAELTLVTCHPKWTSKNRLIVKAKLESSVTPQPATVYSPSVVNVAAVLDSGWFHDSSALPGAIILAIVLALLVIVAKRFVARGQRAQIVYPVTVLMFLPVLFVFFGYLTRLMPVNM